MEATTETVMETTTEAAMEVMPEAAIAAVTEAATVSGRAATGKAIVPRLRVESMSSALESLPPARFDRSPTTAWLVVGDAVVIVGFLLLGALRHGVNPLAQPLRVAGTVAPFLLGWLVAAPLVGAYAPRARRSVGTAAALGVVAWFPANLIGSALRATPYFHGNAPLAFVAVTFGVGAVFLGVWRAAVAWYLS